MKTKTTTKKITKTAPAVEMTIREMVIMYVTKEMSKYEAKMDSSELDVYIRGFSERMERLEARVSKLDKKVKRSNKKGK